MRPFYCYFYYIKYCKLKYTGVYLLHSERTEKHR
ncbi:hypothetical protein VP137E351_P0032 [Vibrio phage 137E35-1]|nr:hypothetical protein VP137E351_P0032 [Vibrio phage 137E35-1]CAH9016046.1 hypothetical protein VP230E391_P0032 [Vibrio phage 230E39-1]